MKRQEWAEQETSSEEILTININLTRRLAAILAGGVLLAAFLGFLAWDQG